MLLLTAFFATLILAEAFSFVPSFNLLLSGVTSKGSRSSKIRMMSSSASVDLTSALEFPANTDNEYSQFRLANGIEVTCVTVSNSEKSSAAMSVRAGAQDDTLAGLAHFTEHAVFLGSEKFPQEDKFKAHLSKHGGSSNGGTGMDMTTFQFEVKSGAFDSTLDIWSNFFVKPLFRDDAIGREVMAVTAEDSKNRILDGRRQLQVMKDLMGSSDCNWAKFSTGNVNTLSLGEAEKNAKELANIMKSFHALNYQPGKMSLALCGPQSLEDLRAMAVRYFEHISEPTTAAADFELGAFKSSAVPQPSEPVYVSGGQEEGNLDRWHRGWETKKQNYGRFAERNAGYPFAPEMQGSLVRMRPTKDLRDVSILVGLPPVKDRYRRNPLRLLSQLLSDQGEGSLFAALQDLKWATGAGGGTRVSTPEFSVFEISVSLTPAGFNHYEEVLALVYAHLNMLLTQADSEFSRVWKELRAQAGIGFNFQEKASAYSLAQFLSRQMAAVPLQHVLSDGWLYDPLEAEDLSLARVMLRAIADPARAVVFLRSRDAFAFLPDDNAEAVTPELASRLFPTLTPLTLESLAGGGDGGLPAGPNRVELNYGVPYHVTRLPASVMQACVGVTGMERAVEAMAPGTFPDEAASRAAGAVRSAFPPPNPYICSVEELEALSGALETGRKQHGQGSDPPVALASEVELGAVDPQIPWAKPVKLTREALWLSRDQMFAQPRTQMNVFVQGYTGADAHPVNGMLSSVFYQAVARRFYAARVAGMGYSVSAGPRGLGFSFHGYSPRLSALAQDVVQLYTSPAFWRAVDPQLVTVCQDRLVRSLRSWRKERPDSLADGIMSYYLAESSRFLPSERLDLAANITYEHFVDRALAMATGETAGQEGSHGRIGIRSYLHGSLDEAALRGIHDVVKEGLGLGTGASNDKDKEKDKDEIGISHGNGALASVEALQERQAVDGYGMTDPPCLARLLPPATHGVVCIQTPNEEDENSALLVHFQTDRMSPATSAHMLFLRRFLHQPFFDKLRTKKQLGYIVSMSSSGYGTARGRKSMRGFTARVLSNRWSPPAMQRELEVFLRDMERVLMAETTQEEVEERARALVSALRDPPTSYREEADEFWGSILDERGFDWTERVISELQSLSLAGLQESYQRWFLNKGGQHRSLAVMLFGKGKTVSLDERVVNAESAEGCGVAPLGDGVLSIFPSTAGCLAGDEAEGRSASGVALGEVVHSLEALKEARGRLELFDPPDDDDDDEGCEEDCELRW